MGLLEECKKIVERTAKKYGISYALLFGSYASKRNWKESDIDIAVKLKNPHKKFKEKIRLMNRIAGEIERKKGVETDVIFLNDADTGLKFEIFRTGKILYYDNYDKFVNDKSAAIGEYLDFNFWAMPLHKKVYESVLHGRK